MTTLLGSAGELILATEEAGAIKASEGGLLAQAAWLIPVVPMVLAFVIVFWGKRSPLKGWGMAVFSMGFVAVFGTVLFAMNTFGDGITYEGTVHLVDIGTQRLGDHVGAAFALEWGWMVDGLSILMYFIVGVVGLAVFVYAKGYMEGDIRYTWFFASFTLFGGGMLVLVSAPNLIQLIVGWELVGVSSYLLIGHYWEDHENSSAAIKAFLVNKVADVGLFVGAIIVAMSVGSFRFTDIMTVIAEDGGGTSPLSRFAFWAGLALFIGAMGKSAQFPLHVWLPDAMAGPTPVSALMHAATMVTAGVYLIGRMFPIYLAENFAGDVRTIIIVIGGLTLFLTGLLALVQDDIKRVLAYSTLSQLGYMTAAMGAGAYTAGLFHLFTHAFFKALLFLGAGSVIHAVHSNNMSDMGGLRKDMPRTFYTFVIGSAALSGIPLLAGFFSKDEIHAAISFDAGAGGGAAATFVLALGIAGAFITVSYMSRAVYLTFYGEYKGEGYPHESPSVMTVPLIGLAIGSAFAGYLNVPGITDRFRESVGSRFVAISEHHAESFDMPILLLSTLFVAGGLVVGYRLWFKDAETQVARDTFAVPVLYPLLRHKYYIDDFYMDGIVRPIRGPVARGVDWINGNVIDLAVNGAGWVSVQLARVVNWFDQRGIDGVINASATVTGGGGGILRLLQTGKVQQYATLIFAGTVLLIAGFIIF